MPLMNGTVSFVELAVPVDTVFDESRVYNRAFVNIDDSYDEVSIGWVNPTDIFDANHPTLVLGDYVVLTMRIDERKIPGALLKKLCAKEERRIRIERQIPKLSRAMRAEIKSRISTDLIRKAAPVTTTVDVVWSVNAGRVWLFSTSSSVMELFLDLFDQTFKAIPEALPLSDTADFLAWCSWKSEVIRIYGRMTIGGEPDQQVVCAEGPESFKALALGKKIGQAQVVVDNHGKGTLTSSMLFKGFKLPVVAADGGVEGLIMERINLVDALIEAVGGEYAAYVNGDRSGLVDWILEQEGE